MHELELQKIDEPVLLWMMGEVCVNRQETSVGFAKGAGKPLTKSQFFRSLPPDRAILLSFVPSQWIFNGGDFLTGIYWLMRALVFEARYCKLISTMCLFIDYFNGKLCTRCPSPRHVAIFYLQRIYVQQCRSIRRSLLIIIYFVIVRDCC